MLSRSICIGLWSNAHITMLSWPPRVGTVCQKCHGIHPDEVVWVKFEFPLCPYLFLRASERVFFANLFFYIFLYFCLDLCLIRFFTFYDDFDLIWVDFLLLIQLYILYNLWLLYSLDFSSLRVYALMRSTLPRILKVPHLSLEPLSDEYVFIICPRYKTAHNHQHPLLSSLPKCPDGQTGACQAYLPVTFDNTLKSIFSYSISSIW